MTLARSTGAVTKVVGTAERKPAAANSGVDRCSDVRFGVRAKIIFLDASYACVSCGFRQDDDLALMETHPERNSKDGGYTQEWGDHSSVQPSDTDA